MVTLDGPLSSAEVSVLRLDGSLIATTTSDGGGHFTVLVSDPPADYRLAAKGGSYRSKVMSGTLYADVRNRPHYGKYAPVNPVTTLASLQVQGGTSFEKAQAATRNFFGIPASSDMGFDLKPDRFSGRLFAVLLEERGSVASTMSLLMGELASGQTHLFQQRVLKGEEEAGVALFVAKGVLSGVLSEGGSEAFSSVMSALGIGGDSGAAAAAAAAQMAKLEEISTAISALSMKLDTVQNVLLATIDQQAYVTALGQNVQQLIEANSYIDLELQALVLNPANSLRRDQLDAYILSRLVQGGMEGWASALYGQSTRQTSLIVMWSKVVQQLNLARYDDQQSASVQAQWDYFDGQQARSLAYVIDYMRAHPEQYSVQTDILPTIERWRANRKLQMSLVRGNSRAVDTFAYSSGDTVLTEETPFSKPLVAGLVVDRATGNVWTTNPISSSLPGNLAQLDAYLASQVGSYQTGTALQGWRLPRLTDIPVITGQATFAGLAALGVVLPQDSRLLLADRLNDGSFTLNTSQLFSLIPLPGSYSGPIVGAGPYSYCVISAAGGGPGVSEWSPLLMDAAHVKTYRFLGLIPGGCPGSVDVRTGDLAPYPAMQAGLGVQVLLTTHVTASDYWYQ